MLSRAEYLFLGYEYFWGNMHYNYGQKCSAPQLKVMPGILKVVEPVWMGEGESQRERGGGDREGGDREGGYSLEKLKNSLLLIKLF